MSEPARWKRISDGLHNGKCGPYQMNTIKVYRHDTFTWSVSYTNFPTYACGFASTERAARMMANKTARDLIARGCPTMTPEQQERYDTFVAKEKKRTQR